ncbi:hypothetical protein [Phenylobacterium sp.]|uniref:hypothetical protein n=1 Tax=Phenylobacterium sp. TaxID=1871053 RepID=UPI002869F21D|nr:hypothetical protein [Phenylobacterium sp.]
MRRYPERDVLCSWPTEGSPWALAAVRAMRPGRRLALIGDGRGGCTGAPGLYRFLETRFEAGPVVILPQFPGVSDRLSRYRRIR